MSIVMRTWSGERWFHQGPARSHAVEEDERGDEEAGGEQQPVVEEHHHDPVVSPADAVVEREAVVVEPVDALAAIVAVLDLVAVPVLFIFQDYHL